MVYFNTNLIYFIIIKNELAVFFYLIIQVSLFQNKKSTLAPSIPKYLSFLEMLLKFSSLAKELVFDSKRFIFYESYPNWLNTNATDLAEFLNPNKIRNEKKSPLFNWFLENDKWCNGLPIKPDWLNEQEHSVFEFLTGPIDSRFISRDVL